MLDRRRAEDPLADLVGVRRGLVGMEKRFAGRIAGVAPCHRERARNLVHYLALRRIDLRDIQSRLASLGLSSLGRSEAHVLGTVDAVLDALYAMAGRARPEEPGPPALASRWAATGSGPRRTPSSERPRAAGASASS